MSRQCRVLVVDDSQDWRDQLVETLQGGGYLVDGASTANEALEKLNEAPYHVMVLDIVMEESDLSNEDGLRLLHYLDEHRLTEATKVIILSAYGNTDRMRTSFKDYKVADFLSKGRFESQAFLENVNQVFNKNMNINLELLIHWQRGSNAEMAVLNLTVDGIRIKRNTPLQNLLATELEDLLCRLFHQAQSILIRPLTPGHSGTGVIWVQPFFTTGGGNPVIVKFGDFTTVEQEYHNCKKYVQPFVGGSRNTTVLDFRRTQHLGGIIYSLLGTSSDQLVDFSDFYQNANVLEIKDALNRLFRETCGAWYANHGHLRPLDLTTDYQQLFKYTQERLEHALSEELKAVQGKQKLYFAHLKGERTFTNPLLATAGRNFVYPTYICTTHGDFNQHNLLVDSTGHIWLIDFQGTGQSHILRDVSMLDSAIRFQLLREEEATLEERLQMEETLISINRFSQMDLLPATLPTANAALAKAYAIVFHLRTWARKLVEKNPSDDASEYYVALLYNALNTMRFASLSSLQREHAILCASLFAEKL